MKNPVEKLMKTTLKRKMKRGGDPKPYKPSAETIKNQSYATDQEVEWAEENDPNFMQKKGAEYAGYRAIKDNPPKAVKDEEINRVSKQIRAAKQKMSFREQYNNPKRTLTANLYDEARVAQDLDALDPEDREIETKKFKQHRNAMFNRGLR